MHRPIVMLCLTFIACGSDAEQPPAQMRTAERGVAVGVGAAGRGAPSVTTRTPDVVSILPAAAGAGPSRPADPIAAPTDTLMPGEACAGIDEMAEREAPPADIIIAVDSTSSMTAETMFVQMQLNAFAQQIVDAKIDVALILICQKPGPLVGNPICIPPPLAAANCGDNEPGFKHIDQVIGNHDAWEQIVAMYPQYKHLLRPGAQKHIVVITDDSPAMPRASFDQMIKSVDAQFEGYKHHAIYASTELGGPFCGEGDGTDYGRLSDETMGVKGNLCLQDFEKVWAELAVNVERNVAIACDWAIPEAPAGETFDPQRVNVHYSGENVAPQLLGWGRPPASARLGMAGTTTTTRSQRACSHAHRLAPPCRSSPTRGSTSSSAASAARGSMRTAVASHRRSRQSCCDAHLTVRWDQHMTLLIKTVRAMPWLPWVAMLTFPKSYEKHEDESAGKGRLRRLYGHVRQVLKAGGKRESQRPSGDDVQRSNGQ
jgi:hypothetical protein